MLSFYKLLIVSASVSRQYQIVLPENQLQMVSYSRRNAATFRCLEPRKVKQDLFQWWEKLWTDFCTRDTKNTSVRTLSPNICNRLPSRPMQQDALTEIGVLSYLRPRIGTRGIGVIETESREGQIQHFCCLRNEKNTAEPCETLGEELVKVIL